MAKILDVGSGWFGGVFANPAENEAAETRNDNIPSMQIILSVVVFTWTRAQHFVPEPLYCVPHQSQLSVTRSPSRFCLCLPCINCYHWDRSNFVAKILRAHTKNDPTMMWRMEWSTLVYITTLQPLLCSTCGHCCCVPASDGDSGPPLVQSALNPSHSSLPSAECCRNTAVFSHLCLMQQHLEICTHFLCPPLRSSLISFDNLSRGNRHGTL